MTAQTSEHEEVVLVERQRLKVAVPLSEGWQRQRQLAATPLPMKIKKEENLSFFSFFIARCF